MSNGWTGVTFREIQARIASALLRRFLGLFVFIGLILLLSGTGVVSPLLSQATASVFALVTPSGAEDQAFDDFERSSLGSNWQIVFGSVAIVDNSDLGLSSASGMGLVAWFGSTFDADQFTEAVISPDKDPKMMNMVSARWRASDRARYGFGYNDDPGGGFWVIKYDGVPGPQTRTVSQLQLSDESLTVQQFSPAPPPQPGDTLRIEVRGSNPVEIKGFHNGNLVLTATDTAPERIVAGRSSLAYRLAKESSTTYPTPAFRSWTAGSLSP